MLITGTISVGAIASQTRIHIETTSLCRGLGRDSVYTPSFVVNGKEWRGWCWRQLQMPIHVRQSWRWLRVSVGDDGKVSATFAP